MMGRRSYAAGGGREKRLLEQSTGLHSASGAKVMNAVVAPRKVLVVVQFTTAIAFIICTLVVYQQLLFVQHRDTGYDKSNLAYVYIKGDIARNYPIIRRELVDKGLITPGPIHL